MGKRERSFWEMALDVECPVCNAGVGHYCRAEYAGQPWQDSTHLARMDAARVHNGQLPPRPSGEAARDDRTGGSEG